MTAAVQLVRSRQQWGDEIRQSLGRAVKAVVQVGFTLKACKTAVGHGGFEEAVRHSGMSRETAFKFMAIAEHPAISNVAPEQHLPQSWTSLYELTKLGDDLPTAIEAGEVKPDMTRRDVIDLVHRYRQADEPSIEPPAPRRKPLTDAFFKATYDLVRSVERIGQLVEDGRFARNAAQVTTGNYRRLAHAHNLLQDIIEAVGEPGEVA